MDKITQLRSLAQEIERRRVTLELSKNVLCQKFGQLGSTKSFGRILNDDDDLAGMDIDRLVISYQAALDLANAYTEDPEENKIYTDFEFVRKLLVTVGEALRETDNTRLILVTGRSGSGKSTLLTAVEEHPHYSKIFHKVEATEGWRAKTNSLLGALLLEVGLFDRQKNEDGDERKKIDGLKSIVGTDARLEKLIERLGQRSLILALDEGHHLGPEGFNIIKTIINRTKVVVIVTAHPELLNRINRSSYAETSQLWENRMFEKFEVPPPTAGDVMEFLRRRGVKFAGEKNASDIAQAISTQAKVLGLWKFVKRCAKQARKDGGPFTAADFATVIAKVKNKIGMGG